jgi:molybdate transport system regulatory protein
MKHPTSSLPSRTVTFTPRVKVWLETSSLYAFGHGLSEILKAVDRTGSIKEAAATLGKSYRYVWNRVKEGEEALGFPLVDARQGGSTRQRSTLTHQACELLKRFIGFRERMIAHLEQEYARFFAKDHLQRSTR